MRIKNTANETKKAPSDPVEDIMNVPQPIVAMAIEYPAGHLIPYSFSQACAITALVCLIRGNDGDDQQRHLGCTAASRSMDTNTYEASNKGLRPFIYAHALYRPCIFA
jgi:hypothetical protein